MTTLIDVLKSAAKRDAGILFVSGNSSDERLTYAKLYSQARKILGGLQQAGVRPGDELVLQTENNKTLIIILWACLLGKIVFIPLSGGVQARQKQKLFKVWKYLTNPHFTGDEEIFTKLEQVGDDNELVVKIQDAYIPIDQLLNSNEAGNEEVIQEDDLAYVQFSSGSTGDPKGVCLTHRNLVSNTADIIRSLEITDRDRLLSWMPLTHDMGLIGFHLTGVVRAIDVVSIPTSLFVRRPQVWMDKTSQYKASVLYSPNFGFQYFKSILDKKSHAWDLRCVRIIVNGAESISLPICNDFVNRLAEYGLGSKVIVTAYGLAEASVEVSAMPVATPIQQYIFNRQSLNIGNKVEVLSEGITGHPAFVDVGIPVSNCKLRICTDGDEVLPEEHVGNIQITGTNVTTGYYNNPAAGTAVFTADNWLRTGDIGCMMNGRLVIIGRKKNLIIINGQNFYPKDIEDAVTGSGIIEEGKIVACGVLNRQGNEELLLFVLHKGDWTHFISLSESIHRQVWQELNIRATHVLPIKQLPKTTSGKVQHFVLVEQYREGAFNDYISFIGNRYVTTYGGKELEEKLIVYSRHLFGNSELSRHSSFLAHGMNSLLSIQLANEVLRLTDRSVSITDVFRADSVDGLLRVIIDSEERSLPSVKASGDQTGLYELSLAQRRIWNECQLLNRSVAYNIPVVYKITGELDRFRLEAAMKFLVSKYEILRTSFETEGGIPKQRIQPHKGDQGFLNYVDLAEFTNPDHEGQIYLERDKSKPFNLEAPSQFRLMLLRLSENKFIFSFVIHHLLVDGWSLQLLMKELAWNYDHGSMKNSVDFDQRVLQFRDYVAWQNEWTVSPTVASSRNYWLEQAAGKAVTLPIKKNESSYKEFIPLSHHEMVIDPSVFQFVRTLSRKYKTSPFTVIMAILDTLLYRYTGEKDIVTGFDVTGRVVPELEALIGYTLNTLCLRLVIDPAETFSQLLERAANKISVAFDKQTYPFEWVLAEKKEQDATNAELFRILVIYHNYPGNAASLQFGQCVTERDKSYPLQGLTDILFEFFEEDKQLELVIHYNTELYSATMIQRFGLHMTNLLGRISTNPDLPIGSYEFLSKEECKVLVPVDAIEIDNISFPTLPVVIDQVADAHPAMVAIISGDKQISYGELKYRAEQVAAYLHDSIGIKAGDRIGFLLNRNEDLVIAMLGIWKAGAVYVAIDHQLPLSRCKQMISDSAIKCLLTNPLFIAELSALGNSNFLININDTSFVDTIGKEGTINYSTGINSPAYIIYTSGSTGAPKGVEVTHRTVAAYVRQFIRYFSITTDDVVLQQGSVSFDVIIEEIFPALCVGARIVIAEQGGRDIHELIALSDRHGVTVISSTPQVLNQINESVDKRIPHLRIIISGGDLLHSTDINHLFTRAQVYNTYGPCEATVCATYKKLDTPEDACLIGKPIEGCHIYLLDENRQLVPLGCTGEIYIGGLLANGYINQPAYTKEKFIDNPFHRSAFLYRSGDRGRWTENGDLEFIGRLDDQIKVRGIRIEPGEIEACLLEFPGIRSAAVVVSKGADEKLIAYLTVRNEIDEDELRIFLKKHLPAYAMPAGFVILPVLPLNTSGKIDRYALSSPDYTKMLKMARGEVVLPQTRNEKLIAAVWEELFNRPVTNSNEDFFETGGHSLKANQLINKIYQRTGIELKIADLFQHTTIRQQGLLLSQVEQNEYSFIELS